MHTGDLYDPRFVERLFNEMAATYGLVNLISSFGLARRWRRQCLRQIEIPRGGTAVDLMTGMGELCPDVARHVGAGGRVVAVDISPVMCRGARRYQEGRLPCPVTIIRADALRIGLPPESADVVVCSFGLKTLSPAQCSALAEEVCRVLKPNGRFSLIEISVPSVALFRWVYLFYLSRIIPAIGWLCMGNPENYRLLGVYTAAFGECSQALSAFRRAGLEANLGSFFFGCAIGLSGRKPGAHHPSLQA